MPPLLLPPPQFVDQSFPRTTADLREVVFAMGRMQELLESHQIELLITKPFGEVVEQFGWKPPANMALLIDAYRLLTQWILQPSDHVHSLDVSGITEFEAHPVPDGCGDGAFVAMWQDEVGRLLVLHDAQSPRDFFVGVGCKSALCGAACGAYESDRRAFPLCGNSEIAKLKDAYEYDIPADLHKKLASVSQVTRNVARLGALDIQSPSGGSHFKVRFPNSRSWVIDPNVDPVPDRFLKQLCEITGWPFDVVKTVLVFGRMPDRRFRLSRAD